MPLRDGSRPLKRWRYVGVYGPDVMLCAGVVHIAVVPVGFWAVWHRSTQRFLEGNFVRPGRRVVLGDDTVRVADGAVQVDLRLHEDTQPWDCTSTHGESWIWTCKTGARAVGTVRIGGETLALDGRALIDDSAGYHARETVWDWSAGIGAADDGRAVMWNLVTGVHDGPGRTENAVWVDGAARETGPAAFAADLGGVTFPGDPDGAALAFTAEAERARHDRAPLFESEYRQPFGTFSGVLPGGVRLGAAYGVMERHRARW